LSKGNQASLADQVTRAVIEYLRDRHWWVLPEFEIWPCWPDKARRADLFAFYPWESRKNRRIVVEVKVSRADFAAELKEPGKRACALAVSSEYYFAVPKGLVTRADLPPEAGLFTVEGGKARMAHRAPERAKGDMSDWLAHSVLVRLWTQRFWAGALHERHRKDWDHNDDRGRSAPGYARHYGIRRDD
jgi:hypothetical protein